MSNSDMPTRRRQSSIVAFEGVGGALPSVLKIENLSSAKLIQSQEFTTLYTRLQPIVENDEIVLTLESEKVSFLFTSANMLRLLQITESIKTKIRIIEQIGPRLVDPASKSGEVLGLFRFAEDKHRVEEILKARTGALNSSVYRKGDSGNVMARGKGGRGGGVHRMRSQMYSGTNDPEQSGGNSVDINHTNVPTPSASQQIDRTDEDIVVATKNAHPRVSLPDGDVGEGSRISLQEKERIPHKMSAEPPSVESSPRHPLDDPNPVHPLGESFFSHSSDDGPHNCPVSTAADPVKGSSGPATATITTDVGTDSISPSKSLQRQGIRGVMEKQALGALLYKPWARRMFVYNEETRVLLYKTVNDNESSSITKGSVCVDKEDARPVSKADSGRDYAFEIYVFKINASGDGTDSTRRRYALTGWSLYTE